MTKLVKSSKEIQIIKEGGEKLSSIFEKLIQLLKPGVNLLDIEEKAKALIKQTGGKPAFSQVPTYKWATCLNINDVIVHGVPEDYLIKSGDVINLDIGLYYKGFNTDMSGTVYINSQKEFKNNKKRYFTIKKFLDVGKKALKEAKKQAKVGNRVGDISQTIEKVIEGAGYSCARNLTGHGIGKKLHEPPNIPCFLKDKIEKTPLLKNGMVLAIEVIYTIGKPDLVVDPKDKWTIRTKDGKISAVFEETIAINKNCQVLTKLPFLGG